MGKVNQAPKMNPAQFVLIVNLSADAGNPNEQLRRATTDAPFGSMIRVMVGDVAPLFFAPYPLSIASDIEWFRPDLFWQFTSKNAYRLSQWQSFVRELEKLASDLR